MKCTATPVFRLVTMRFANALTNANERRVGYVAPKSVKLIRDVGLLITTSFRGIFFRCEGSREGFARISATIDMESFLKISS